MTIRALTGLPAMPVQRASEPALAWTHRASASLPAPSPSVLVTLSGQDKPELPATYAMAAVAPLGQAEGGDPAQATLAIRTTAGRSLTLVARADGSGFDLTVDGGGTPDDAETAALKQLGEALRTALDGLASQPPRLNLSSLMQYDSRTISSLHLTAVMPARGGTSQTIDLQADAQSRSVAVDGPGGKLAISVDVASAAIVGDAARRAQSVDRYLAEFDQARSRGKGDTALMTLFKDAFAQMNGIDATDASQDSRASWLTDTDHALLSGLPDFKASVTQTAVASNPYRTDEYDAFSYEISQDTRLSGKSAADRGYTQDTQSRLRASYHSALSPDATLDLTDRRESQNYYYTQIDDTAQGTVGVDYRKGQLVRANVVREASQATHRTKYEMGQAVKDVVLPLQRSQAQDLLPLLQPMERHAPRTAREREERNEALERLHGSLGFEPDPTRL